MTTATPSNVHALSTRSAVAQIQLIMSARNVPFLKGSPGIGKSAIIKQIAKDAGLFVIDHRLSTSSPEDLSGLPRFDADGKARFSPFADLFPLVDTPIPQGYSGFLIFLDEFNSCSKDVQAAAYKLILDRMVGQHQLHPEAYIICAGNKDTDRAIVNPISTAMQSRIIHLTLEFNFTEWMEDVVVAKKWHPAIFAFLSETGAASAYDFKPSHQESTFCCPRTWEFMNRMMQVIEQNNLKPADYAVTFNGTISADVATKFVAYTANYLKLPTVAEILSSPDTAKVPSTAGERYAITSILIQRADDDNMEMVLKYLARLDMTFRVMFMRNVILMSPGLRKNKFFIKSQVDLSGYLN